MRHRDFVRILTCCALLASWSVLATAAVKLPAVIGDNLVLQRGQPVPIWGWADKGEEVTVAVTGQSQAAKADDQGRWKVVLDKLDVGEPREMTVKASSGSTLTLKNILVGEVWVGSGQSNMELDVSSSRNAAQEIAAAKYPQIHLFTVAKKKAAKPQTDCTGQWVECSPSTVPGFSAAAYYFGRQLHKELNVPVGLIHSSWGGSGAAFWVSRKTLKSIPAPQAAGRGRSVVHV